ncbi:MAG: DUF1573 domain-containing protein [Prevotellaceae bacterium]|nr:DUF1573 domain-containing protein [Prevotellaceae bacterium]
MKGEIMGIPVEKEQSVLTEVFTDSTIVTMGKFNWKEERTATFILKNAGKKPLVLDHVSTSCGCTTVSFTQEPVPPGEKAEVKVAYKATTPGC